jgi:hypothetical protein
MAHQALELDSLMGFGKYRDCTLEHVINNDLSYITWMLDKTDRPISAEASELMKEIELTEGDYPEAWDEASIEDIY